MLISLITAWLATVCAILTAFKYFAKKNKKMNKIFHNIHIPLGVLLIVAGLLHGLLAGNPLGTTISKASFGNVLFTWNMGTVCFVFAILLGISYLIRKVLKKNWMKLHRLLTVLFAVSLVIHVFQMGITLPYAISNPGKEVSNSETSDVVKENEINYSDSLVIFAGAILKDGTYEGLAEGYKDTIKVSVVVENGLVTEINIVEENDTPQYFERAKEIIDTIINNQSLEIDGISGATYSSKGIQNAVNNALQSAVIDGEIKITDIQIKDTHGKKKHRK